MVVSIARQGGHRVQDKRRNRDRPRIVQTSLPKSETLKRGDVFEF